MFIPLERKRSLRLKASAKHDIITTFELCNRTDSRLQRISYVKEQ